MFSKTLAGSFTSRKSSLLQVRISIDEMRNVDEQLVDKEWLDSTLLRRRLALTVTNC